MKRLLLACGIGMIAIVPCTALPRYDKEIAVEEEAYADITVAGKVTGENGVGLAGATVQAKGTNKTTLTTADGSFSIEVPEGSKILVVSYIGLQPQEIDITGKTTVLVSLTAIEEALEDVIVVGYGTQRKVNLSGSVSTVTGEVLTKRPAPNSTNLLQGRVAGLQITQTTSEPGRDDANILLRGRGSFSGGTNNSPLVLIDGVAGSLGNLSPDDIENITVLKDAASASIYGSRAANGVILVTTKKGRKGKPVISYRVNVAQHKATAEPNLISNSAEYMEMFNRATAYSNGVTFRYPQADIDKYKAGDGTGQYPNFNSFDYYVKPAMVTNHSISLSGGTDKSTYNISLGYLDQDALLPVYNFKRYNLLLNYTNQITKNITIGTSINGTFKNRFEPPFTSENLLLGVYAAGPLYGPFLPDGSGRIVSRAYNLEGRNRNPQEMFEMGWQRNKEYNLNAQAFMDVKLMKGLNWSSKVAVNYTDEYYKMYQHPYSAYLLQERVPATGDYVMSSFGPDILGVVEQYSKAIQPTVYSTLTYDTRIADNHNIKVLAGYEQISYAYRMLRGRRVNTVSYSLEDIAGYTATGETLLATHPRLPGVTAPNDWALQSFFGRLNYDYQGKYLLEANLRYDGSSKVSPDYRWGLFPSVSAAWLVSKESFMDALPWLSVLKLRGSFGTLGNQDVGNYLYQPNLTVSGIVYSFDNNSAGAGAVNNTFRDQSLRWESSQILDFGFDLELKKGLLGITFDWFRKNTYGILAAQPIPASLGLGAPTTNDGRMRNKGIELELRHQNTIGQLRYGANFVISTANNTLMEIRTPSVSGRNIRQVGLPYDAHYLYLVEGVVQTGETPMSHSLTPIMKAGDLKMKDVNKDGMITPDDRVVIDGAYPKYIYSFGVNADYKGFGLSIFFQGVEGLKARQGAWGVDPFQQGTAPTEEWRNAWTPTNASNTMPALYISGYNHMNQYGGGSEFYLKDASYLRLKNVTLSYEIPQKIVSKIRATGLSIYVSGDNLLTFTKFTNGDPERPNFSTANSPTTNGSQYPQVRILNAGLNIKF